MFIFRYPVGHPSIITKDFKDLKEYFGLAKVKVLPPHGLYHAVLPVVSNGKLKFPLCATCADNECDTDCQCPDPKRYLVGTWCTPEINKALEKGYKLIRIYEVYHFHESIQYDGLKGTPGLMSDFVDKFLKVKQEASGWPEWCQTEEDKTHYIRAYKENEGIQLDPKNIEKNPGQRSLAKLMLNRYVRSFFDLSSLI